jgi:hypothetical protein
MSHTVCITVAVFLRNVLAILSHRWLVRAAAGRIARMSTSKSSNYFQLYNELTAVVKLTAATNSKSFRRINKRYGW